MGAVSVKTGANIQVVERERNNVRKYSTLCCTINQKTNGRRQHVVATVFRLFFDASMADATVLSLFRLFPV